MRACAITFVLGLSSGCAWTPKPYANDPLIRARTALPGDPYAVPPPKSIDVPQPPQPPDENGRVARASLVSFD